MCLVRRDMQPQHVAECRVLVCRLTRAVDHAPWRRNTTRAVMSWSLVPSIHVCPGRTQFHSDPLSSCTSRTVPAYCASSRSQTHKPHHHGLRRHEHVHSDVQPEEPKTVNNALLTMRGSCDYVSGKRHTICVATRVVRLRAFRKRPRPAIEYAGTTVTCGSAVDRSRSAETQRHRSFLVGLRRRHAATWHRQRDRRN